MFFFFCFLILRAWIPKKKPESSERASGGTRKGGSERKVTEAEECHTPVGKALCPVRPTQLPDENEASASEADCRREIVGLT